MVGASNFHLLGVGAEKSSLYRLGFLGFDAYLLIILLKGEGLIKELKATCLTIKLERSESHLLDCKEGKERKATRLTIRKERRGEPLA